MTRKYTVNERYDPAADLHFMRKVWTDSRYGVADIAFRIRAVVLARIECKIYHQQQKEIDKVN